MPQPDEGEDPMGRLGLAAVSVSASGGRVVVFGDSDFASNEPLTKRATSTSSQRHRVACRRGRPGEHPAWGEGTFTMSTIQGLIVWLVSVLLIHALMIGVPSRHG